MVVEGTDGIEMVGVNGRLVGRILHEYGGGSNCIGFSMLDASSGIRRERGCEGIVWQGRV